MNQKYNAGIEDMVSKGYAEKVTDDELNLQCDVEWYLPHHVVISDKKPGKFRIVFDCSAKFAGVSLNDAVNQGPNLTNSLVGVLQRFREHEIAVAGDIEAMYHQVKVADHHRDALRFLWWRNGEIGGDIEVYRMTSHLFGGIWSASCANYALKRVAKDNSDFDNETVQTINDNFYVDDYLKSVKTEKKAIDLVQDISELLQRGGFRITKWITNNRQVLKSIHPENRAKEFKDIELCSSDLPQEKALGVKWDTETDKLVFKFQPKQKPLTKRGLMSVLSSVYDPIGFLAPLILQAKKIFQDECRLHKDWDSRLEPENVKLWTEWLDKLPHIEELAIPRCLVPIDFGDDVQMELHHFADASSAGYGVVSYLRIQNSDGRVHCAFLIGKSRLAPIKTVTIPRLELCAAVLSVKLDEMLRKEMRLEIRKSTFWSDSMIVLYYIRNETQRYQTFVANRVTQIRQGSSPDDWRYVNSALNPADDASRGVDADQLLSRNQWFQGPDFLYGSEETWPKSPEILEVSKQNLEIKGAAMSCEVNETCDSCTNRLMLKYSTWYELKKGVAWILRLKQCLLDRVKGQSQASVSSKPIKVGEMKVAEVEIVKFLQKSEFVEDIYNLKKGNSVKRSSKLSSLEPFLNADGVMCVGGRLKNAPISEEFKHQMILPKKHFVSVLVIRDTHKYLGHSGTEHVLSEVRQRFWIVGARRTIKSVLRQCVICKRLTGQLCGQKMADLPMDRVTPGKPFSSVGIDCFGPFQVKIGRSRVKRYGCIFTCLTTRAVHIEKLDTMETDSFINGLRRFESRRGVPDIVRSDNGTNFKGAEKELGRAIQDWNQQQINKYMLQRQIQWCFNPPFASHMGGVWERQIRTVRKF